MALTKVINDLADLNQSGSTNALKGCVGTTAQQPTSSSTIEYLMVAGGGGGGGWGQAGGGGAGGYVTGSTTVYQGRPAMLTIGEGGAGGYNASTVDSIDNVGNNGNDSGFNGLRAIGGGGGGSYNDPGLGPTITYANNGGSGGGAGTQGQNNNQADVGYGKGVTGQGNDGGTTYNASGGGYVSPWMGGGGGGAGAPGEGGLNAGTGSGNGGVGIQINDPSGINMISTDNAVLAGVGENSSGIWVSGGGGGGAYGNVASSGGKGGASGTAGGSANGFGYDGTDGTVNTGAGGSGASGYSNLSPGSVGTYYRGGAGGSGLGILKYDNTIVTGYTLNSEDTYTINWPADMLGIAYWPLNLNNNDVGGNYNLTNASGGATPSPSGTTTYVTGKFNQAASFNGSSDYLYANGPVLQPSKNFSVSVWVKFNSVAAASTGIIGNFKTGVTPQVGWVIAHSNGTPFQFWADGTASSSAAKAQGTTTIETDIWYHVVGTYDGSNVKIYVNGSLENTVAYTATPAATDQPLVIGRWYGNYSDYYLDGLVEQARLYASAISLTEVQDIYNNSKPGSLPPLKTSSDLTTGICNYPSGVTGLALYQFSSDATDTCGSYNGTNDSGVAYNVPGVWGNCAQFGGGADRIDIDEALLGSGTTKIWSTSMWVKTSQTGSEQLLNNTAAAWSQAGYAVYFGTSGNLRFQTSGAASYSGYMSYDEQDLFDGEWHHIVATYSSAGGTNDAYMYLYVDGVNVTDLCTAGNSWVQGGGATYNTFTIPRITLGNWADSSSYPGGLSPFVGEMDQVRFFNTALTAQQVYDLWQKENDIQTHFSSTDPADTTPANTDILVFKEGSGEITFKNDSPPGAEVGMIRTNTDLSSANSTSAMEHFTSGGWKDFTNCTTSVCNYPTSAIMLYQFNDNTNDTCGNYNATFTNNITYGVGKFNRAASFNGSSSRVNTGYNIPGSLSGFSVSAWVKAASVKTQYIVGDMGTAGAAAASMFYINISSSDELRAGVGGTTSQVIGTMNSNNYIDTWIHIVVTTDSSGNIKGYVDGSELGTATGNALAANTEDFIIGMFGDTASGSTFDGLIDQVRVFQSELSASEVTQLYNEIYCP